MRSISRVGRVVEPVFTGLALLVIASVLCSPVSAASPSQAGVSWDYKLLGKLNSAQDPATGLRIVITGSGSFNVLQPSISGGGSYTIFDTSGSVVGTGTWTAKTLTSFIATAPGRSPGEGGHLVLLAGFNGTGTGALLGLKQVVIQCSMWGETVGPPGYPWPSDYVEAGSYTTHVTGAVMFNLNQ